MNCDLAEKGRADFVAGTKDEALYGDYERGMDYRRGWQLARLASLAPKPDATPWTGETPPKPETPIPVPKVQPEGITTLSHRPPPRERAKAPKPAPAGQIDLFS